MKSYLVVGTTNDRDSEWTVTVQPTTGSAVTFTIETEDVNEEFSMVNPSSIAIYAVRELTDAPIHGGGNVATHIAGAFDSSNVDGFMIRIDTDSKD